MKTKPCNVMDYKNLRTKFLELFELNHIALDLLYALEDESPNAAKHFILNKMYNELSSEELIEILGKNYILDYYAI